MYFILLTHFFWGIKCWGGNSSFFLNFYPKRVRISPSHLLPFFITKQPIILFQKLPPRNVPRKRCSGNMQQIYRKKHPCRNVISRKLFCNFIEITRRYGCSPVTLLHIFRIFFTKNTSGWLLLLFEIIISLTIIVKVVTFIIAQFTWLCCSKWSGNKDDYSSLNKDI